MRPAPITLIVADDHELIRNGITAILEKEAGIMVVAEAANGDQLVQLTALHRPDLIITDIKMPLMDGLAAARIISEKYPGTGIIALTMYDTYQQVSAMVDAGATGFLLKNSPKKELLEAISAVHHHQKYYCAAISVQMAWSLNSLTGPQTLSEKEREIICLVCEGWPAEKIARHLHRGVRTTEKYRERIRAKTGCNNVAELVKYALKNGICGEES